ncbi:MAG: CHAT domain-containing protein [Bacteroidetes bacterium]|nr:CHAT domain-containing protein [Bacteroidota bacterium]
MSQKKLSLYGKKNPNIDTSYTHEENFFSLQQSYQLSTTRAEGEHHEISISDDECIEFIFDDNTTWFGNANTLNELFPNIDANKRSLNDASELPFSISTDDDQRSLKSVALKIFNVFAKKAIQQSVHELAAYLEKKLLDNQSGLYQVSSDFELQPYQVNKTMQPVLLFLHGTGSSSKGSFAELHGSFLWQEMQRIYQQNILAFQHETFTKSPLQNAFEVLSQLPEGSKLHLITHSRGGLVGEVIARFCSDANGFDETGMAMLERIGRTADCNYIKKIRTLITKKKITVDKFIRVACPAKGTSLLSNRLDFYFNVSMNLLSLTSGGLNPIAEGFKALIASVLESKNDVNILPGLESMSPSSPFLKVLNAPDKIQNNVLVIAGNSEFSLTLKGLIVIITKLVFKGENDFVVNTASMYQGTKRENNLHYFFDEGAEVNHFSYFKNKKTQTALLEALNSKENPPASFHEYIPANALSDAERGVFGLEGGSVFYDEVSGKKPIVILLAGIMGSTLSKEGAHIWLNYLRLVMGGLSDLAMDKKGIKSKSLIKTSYKDICEYLSEYYDVVTFPYDWRISVTESAKNLHDKIVFLQSYQQPIKILAHSMGGVLAREFILTHPTTWKNLNQSEGFKLLMLGTPWMGSYRIANVFCGRDGIIKSLDSLDFAHSKSELIDLFAGFPGILNLLPTRKTDHDFADEKTWIELQKASKLQWRIPPKATLTEFGKFKKRVQDHEANIDFTNIYYIAGKDDITQAGYTIDKGEITFQATARGDQSVTWETGIPTKLRNTNSLYYSQITHGALANDESLFTAIHQILKNGTTDLLSRTEPNISDKTRSLVQLEAEELFEPDEVTAIHQILGLPLQKTKTKISLPALKVRVSNGDLMFSQYPIIIGHFKGDGIVSAERVADTYLKGELSMKHVLGNYPGEIGTHQFALKQEEEFNGACIIGIGEVDKLTAQQLTVTVEKAMIEYLSTHCRISGNSGMNKSGISTLLIGTDYGGLSVESSIRSIIQGIQFANAKMHAVKPNDTNLIHEVEFIELFEDRALQCFYSIKKIMMSSTDEIQIEFTSNKIKNLLGRRKRLLAENKSDWWQRLTVLAENETSNQTVKRLNFYTSTNGAREEKKELLSSTQLIENLLENISTNDKWTPEVAKTIFELLIPNDFKENIRRQTDILWVLDEFTAAYPWELFQTDIEKTKPLCVNSGMIRQLATTHYKMNTSTVNNKNVLVIGDPITNGFCNQLPGAENEAKQVEKLFGEFDYQITSMIKSNSHEIITALFKTEYKMIHISGHGNFSKTEPEKSGMIIGDNVFFTPREFNQLSYTPEFVFVNCCYLGKVDSEQEALYQSRYRFAANIGTQLIQNGVKAVIAAGWAVDDAAALEFANVFYRCMFEGYEFGKAVLQARKTIFEKYPNTNTWGAFQCYGDPFYKVKLSTKRSEKSRHYIITQEAENDVENLLSKAQIAYFDAVNLLIELDAILEAVYQFEVETPELLEKIAIAYVELDEYQKAITLFKKILTYEKAGYSVSSLEKYNNILAKQTLDDYLHNFTKERNYEQEMDMMISSLTKLLEIAETSERHSLIGSAYKRKAIICNKRADKIKALTQAAHHYYQAHENQKSNATYSLVNWIEIEYFLHQLDVQKWGGQSANTLYKLPTLSSIKAKLEKSFADLQTKISFENHDYWDLISKANVSLCLWLLDGMKDEDKFNSIVQAYKKPWENVGSKNKKMSEIEHFDLLIDFSKLTKVKTMQTIFTSMKEALLKEITA